MEQRQTKLDTQILTRREQAILKLIAEGYENKEIGDRFCVGERNIRETQIRLMKKLNARSITSVFDYAFEKGLFSLFEILESRFSK